MMRKRVSEPYHERAEKAIAHDLSIQFHNLKNDYNPEIRIWWEKGYHNCITNEKKNDYPL